MSGQEIQLAWQRDFNIATEISKAENKPILIYFSKSNCEVCLQFYTDFFKQESFKKMSDDFVLLILDGSNDDINTNDVSILKARRLVMHYNKSSQFPAILIVDQDRQQIGEIFTSGNADDISNYWSFLQTLK